MQAKYDFGPLACIVSDDLARNGYEAFTSLEYTEAIESTASGSSFVTTICDEANLKIRFAFLCNMCP